MKMNSAQIRQTLHQFEAQAIPAGHPVMPQLERMFGEHTYFLDGNGVNIVEPVEPEQSDGLRGMVVNLASWIDDETESLLLFVMRAVSRSTSTAAMKKAVTDQGLSIDEYATVLEVAQNDPVVRDKLLQRLK